MAAFPETLRLEAGGLAVEAAPSLGGRVTRFWAPAGKGYDLLAPIRHDIPLGDAVRRGGCYPLAPYSNRIAGASFTWKGRRIALQAHPLALPNALHGIAWARPFAVISQTAASVILQHDHAGDADWPWPLSLQQDVTLSPDTLRLDLTVINHAAEAQPIGLGFHPFFPRRSRARLRFAARGLWRSGPDLLPQGLYPLPQEFDFSEGRSVPEGLDHVFEAVRPAATIVWPAADGAPAWRLELSASSRLNRAVVFSPPGSDVFCFEPVSHPTNALNAPARPGIFRLKPGAAVRQTLKLKAEMIL